MGTPDPASLVRVAIDAARAAGELLLERFRGPASGVGSKSSPTDLVSEADRASEALIRARIRAARPGDAIVGEEQGTSEG
ncbi:MAG: inositol monophosphatase family protein, partial [Actinomycetota bacterium]